MAPCLGPFGGHGSLPRQARRWLGGTSLEMPSADVCLRAQPSGQGQIQGTALPPSRPKETLSPGLGLPTSSGHQAGGLHSAWPAPALSFKRSRDRGSPSLSLTVAGQGSAPLHRWLGRGTGG